MLPEAFTSEGELIAYSATNLDADDPGVSTIPRVLYAIDKEEQIRRLDDLEPAPEVMNLKDPVFGGVRSPGYFLVAPR